MKGKKCPACGTFNRISNIICTGCGEDLLRVPVTEGKDVPAENKAVSEVNAGNQADAAEFKRKCPRCGQIHPYRKSRCECGMLLLTQPPYTERSENSADASADAQTEEEKTVFLLRSEDGRCEIKLCGNADLFLGRKETAAEYLSQKSFVSSRHARIYLSEGEVLLEHVGSTNPTLVNGKEILPNTPILLEPGDTVCFGARQNQEYQEMAAYFRLYVAE